MALMDYGRCRKYNQYVKYLTERFRVSFDMKRVHSFYSPAQYAQLIHATLAQLCNNSSQKRKVISDMKAYATIKIVPEKYFDWIKSNRRVACYAWFRIFSNPEISWKKTGLLCSTPAQNPKPLRYSGQELISMYSGNVDFEGIGKRQKQNADEHEESKKGSNSQEFCFDLPLISDDTHVSRHAHGINFENFIPVNDSKESYLLSIMKEVDSFGCDNNAKITIINETYHSWVKVFHQYPAPFSWINLDEDENVFWLWNYMRKNYISCDVLPATSKQMKDFIVAIFDCWAGWSAEQASIMNVDVNGFQPDMAQSKEIFLARAHNSWIQKRHREKKTKDISGIKLTAQSKKKLLALHNATGVEPNVLLKSFIDDAYKKMKSENNG